MDSLSKCETGRNDDCSSRVVKTIPILQLFLLFEPAEVGSWHVQAQGTPLDVGEISHLTNIYTYMYIHGMPINDISLFAS